MRQMFYIVVMSVAFVNCNSNPQNNRDEAQNIDTIIDSLIVTDSIEEDLIIPDTINKKDDLKLAEIAAADFDKYNKAYESKCKIDENGFIPGYGLKIKTECEQICESYLIDIKARKKMFLPSSFDQGLIGMRFSPSCNQFYVFSSYDGPDYEDYYDYRAEIMIFSIVPSEGLQSIKLTLDKEFREWSIESVVWINDTILALKVYEDHGENFKYYKAEF